MLSDDARQIARQLRHEVGKDSVGIGPDIERLRYLCDDMDPPRIARALTELEGLGFIGVERCIGTSGNGRPRELRSVVGVQVLEPLQAYFD